MFSLGTIFSRRSFVPTLQACGGGPNGYDLFSFTKCPHGELFNSKAGCALPRGTVHLPAVAGRDNLPAVAGQSLPSGHLPTVAGQFLGGGRDDGAGRDANATGVVVRQPSIQSGGKRSDEEQDTNPATSGIRGRRWWMDDPRYLGHPGIACEKRKDAWGWYKTRLEEGF